jgi:hypothetical protein
MSVRVLSRNAFMDVVLFIGRRGQRNFTESELVARPHFEWKRASVDGVAGAARMGDQLDRSLIGNDVGVARVAELLARFPDEPVADGGDVAGDGRGLGLLGAAHERTEVDFDVQGSSEDGGEQ